MNRPAAGPARAFSPAARWLAPVTAGLLLLGGCAGFRSQDSDAVDASRLLAEHDPAAVRDASQAGRALEAVSRERARLLAQWRYDEWACYQRFLVNRCLDRLGARRRAAELRLRTIEIRARQVQREDRARRDASDEALDLGDRSRREADRVDRGATGADRERVRVDARPVRQIDGERHLDPKH